MNGSETSDFYDGCADAYFEKTFFHDMSGERSRLARLLKPGARILDAGSGSCRDTMAFREMGFEVVPTDPSEGMRRIASERLGIDVLPFGFLDMAFDEEFDGVWASASLLHLHPDELPGALDAVHRALRSGGAFYCSFKEGSFEGIREGRWYTDMDETRLRNLLASCGFRPEDVRTDTGPGGILWVSAVSIRQRYDGPTVSGSHEIQQPEGPQEEDGRKGRHHLHR